MFCVHSRYFVFLLSFCWSWSLFSMVFFSFWLQFVSKWITFFFLFFSFFHFFRRCFFFFCVFCSRPVEKGENQKMLKRLEEREENEKNVKKIHMRKKKGRKGKDQRIEGPAVETIFSLKKTKKNPTTRIFFFFVCFCPNGWMFDHKRLNRLPVKGWCWCLLLSLLVENKMKNLRERDRRSKKSSSSSRVTARHVFVWFPLLFWFLCILLALQLFCLHWVGKEKEKNGRTEGGGGEPVCCAWLRALVEGLQLKKNFFCKGGIHVWTHGDNFFLWGGNPRLNSRR